MKRAFALASLFAALFLAVAPSAQTNSAAAMLRVAMDKAQVDGDLSGAIRQYQTIVDTFAKTDRASVATALVKMAECYQRLGDAQTRKIYERVVRDFAEQGEAVALARARLAGSGTSNVMNSRLVWSGPKVDDEGTVSPDGRYISFTDWDTNDLAVHEFATGEDRRITEAAKPVNGKSPEFAEESAISRDGKRVAYSWWDEKTGRYELRLANLTAKANAARLYDNPDVRWIMPFDWAPDGKSVAVFIQRVDRTRQLGLVSVPEGSLRVLKSIEWRSVGRMFFSPDGRWLGYDIPESVASPEHQVSALSVDGSRELHVDHHGQDQMVGWSPDGKWLLFSSDRTGSTDLWAAPFSDGPLGSPQLLKAGFERARPLGVTSSGTLYYAQAKGGGRSRIQIASIDVAAERFASPSIELPQSYQDSYTQPSWSPDGSRLAYVSQRGSPSAKTYVLVIRSNESGQVRELQPKLSYLALLSWAPDGHSLLITGSDFKGRFGLYLVDSETADVKAVGPDESRIYGAVWSPDGRSLLSETNAGLYRIDATTGVAVEVFPRPATQGNWGMYPAWAPDGRRIYYQHVFKATYGAIEDCATVERDLSSGRERELARKPGFVCIPKLTLDGRHVVTANAEPARNSRVLRIMSVDGSESRELMSMPSEVKAEDLNNPNLGPALIQPMVWAPDPLLVVKRLGDRTGSVLSGKDPSELWLVPLTGREPKKIGYTPAGFTSMTVSADGRHIAYALTDAGRPTTEIWTLENFLPTQTSRK